MQSFTSPSHDQTGQNHLHLCGTVEVQVFQLLVLRDSLHRRHEAWFIKKEKRKLFITFLQDKLLLKVFLLKKWNLPRCSQIDRKPKRIIGVNSATYPITGFQKNNLEYIATIEMHHKMVISFFVKEILRLPLHRQHENITISNINQYLEGCISERISSSKPCKPTTNNNSRWCGWLSSNILTTWTWHQDKISCFISVKVTHEIICLNTMCVQNYKFSYIYHILIRTNKFQIHF